MTTLTWQNKSISLYPWDTTDTILHRISEKENVPASYLQVRQDFNKILNDIVWEEEIEVHIDVANLTKDWDQPDMITTMKNMDKKLLPLYVRFKTQAGDIDEPLWDTLFRYEFQNIPFQEWVENVRQLEQTEKAEGKRACYISQLYEELSLEEKKPIMGWKSEKHRMRYQIQDPRPIGKVFADTQLGTIWRMALFYQKIFLWGEKERWIVKMQRLKDPSLESLAQDLLETRSSFETGAYLYHQDMDTPVSIRSSGMDTYEIQMETNDRYSDLIEKVQMALGFGEIQKQTDVGMVGHFIFPQFYVDISLFQDMCMNDPVVSHFLYINELNRATFDTQVGVHFRQDLQDTLGVVEVAASKHFDFSIKNTHRQTGFQTHISLHTPLSEKHLTLFFLFLQQIMGRYVRRRASLLIDYTQFLPSFPSFLEKIQKSLIKNIKSTRPEYISKYPRLFVRNLYSVICQKNLQPTLLKEDETYDLPPESFLLFPPQPIAEINPEYYYCPNKDYPYAGLKEMDLKGQDVFLNLVPCCFNSPQDKENERKLSKLRSKDDLEEEEKEKKTNKTNIISGKFLIKYPGQLGTIRPPSMNRFFMAYDPFFEYFRVGTEQSPSSLLHCMLSRRNLMGINTPYEVADVRVKISDDMDCVVACIQENPGLKVEEIKADIANPNVYFDPRRFYRAVELYFGVRLLVFSKEQDIALEDAHLLFPFSMRTHYSNHSGLPFTIVFEHWGGKTNILSKFKHPHCELIGFKAPTEPSMRFDFNPKGIFQLLDHVLYPFDGNQSIQPFYRKECWFFRHIIGQSADPLGKVRWIHFQYYNQNFYAEIEPPLAIQDDLGVGELPTVLPVVSARTLVRFLNKFDHWESIHIPDPEGDIVYWTVSQDHVLWKSLEENTKLRLTFVCRLEKPQPENIQGRDDMLQNYIKTTPPYSMMMYKPPTPFPNSLHHKEKIALVLSQLCVSAFSFFLKEHNVQMDAMDADVLLGTFAKDKIKIDPHYIYPEQQLMETGGFLSNKKLVLPSVRFWEKIQYHLRWLLFYQPHILFDPDKTTPNYFQEIGDFVMADPVHYYCDLDHLPNVLRYSIEDLYELVSCPLEELPDVCKKQTYTIWYHQDLSPYSHPSIVVWYPTYTLTLLAARMWHQEHRVVKVNMLVDMGDREEVPVYDWEPSLQRWRPPTETETDAGKMLFRARVREDDYLLFFPLN